MNKELRYLRDPLKLADHVRSILRNDEEPKALELARAASKDIECTVAWNHLIDYGMSKGKVNATLKLYNEVRAFGLMMSYEFELIKTRSR